LIPPSPNVPEVPLEGGLIGFVVLDATGFVPYEFDVPIFPPLIEDGLLDPEIVDYGIVFVGYDDIGLFGKLWLVKLLTVVYFGGAVFNDEGIVDGVYDIFLSSYLIVYFGGGVGFSGIILLLFDDPNVIPGLFVGIVSLPPPTLDFFSNFCGLLPTDGTLLSKVERGTL